MKTADFDYFLPPELIAQTPLADRQGSRLLVCERDGFGLKHDHFYNIADYFEAGDVLVVNDTRVLPARLTGVKQGTDAVIEILLLRQIEGDLWETLAKPAKRVKVGSVVWFGDGLLKATCTAEDVEGIRLFSFTYQGVFLELLDRLGEMPLPPYIHEKLLDRDRYQTVYSKVVGSAAAPTAGLHFTPALLDGLRAKGVSVASITLHVGLGTFRPVAVEDVTTHKMHSEFYAVSAETAALLQAAKAEGRRIVAVGTTTTRTLESVMAKYGRFAEASGWTDIFIYPGFAFRAIDGLITNFHLPKSTLIMLVSAFASKAIIQNAYAAAIAEKYRFFSFGDAMILLPSKR